MLNILISTENQSIIKHIIAILTSNKKDKRKTHSVKDKHSMYFPVSLTFRSSSYIHTIILFMFLLHNIASGFRSAGGGRMGTIVSSTFQTRALGNLNGDSISEVKSDSKIILYDGVCNFCNKWVDLLLKLDKKKQFTFSALQSTRGKELLDKMGKDRSDISSVIYIQSLAEDKYYFKSDAALKVMEELGLGYRFTSILVSFLAPRFVRDVAYDAVATNRYKILGKRDDCRCSDPVSPERFK